LKTITKKIALYISGLLCIAGVMEIGVGAFADAPSIIFMIVAVIAGRYIYGNAKIATFAYAIGIFTFLFGVVEILLSMSSKEYFLSSFAVSILPLFFASIIIIYFLKVNEILDGDEKDVVSTKRTKSFWIEHAMSKSTLLFGVLL